MNFGVNIKVNKFGIFIIVTLLVVMYLYVFSSNKSELEKTHIVSLKKLLIAAIETAVKGGNEIVDVYKESKNLNVRSKGKTKDGEDLPLTNADEKSNCAMYYSLVHTFPHVRVISEEVSSEPDCRILQSLDLDQNNLRDAKDLGDEQILSSTATIWIDPLDATKEFTENLLQYVTTMVCVAVNGEPVIGVIHFPFREEAKTFWGWVSRGVSSQFQNKKDITAESRKTVIVSRSHAGKVESLKQALGDEFNIISAGGAGYKILEVANGNVGAYVHTSTINKWDICAGNAIINALNGQMTTLGNEKIDYEHSKVVKNDGGVVATLERNSDLIEKLKSIKVS